MFSQIITVCAHLFACCSTQRLFYFQWGICESFLTSFKLLCNTQFTVQGLTKYKICHLQGCALTEWQSEVSSYSSSIKKGYLKNTSWIPHCFKNGSSQIYFCKCTIPLRKTFNRQCCLVTHAGRRQPAGGGRSPGGGRRGREAGGRSWRRWERWQPGWLGR